MTKDKFKNIIETHKEFYNKLSKLHDIGFNLFDGKYEVSSDFHELFNNLISLTYNGDGVDWINWFIYETDYGNKNMDAKDENGNAICYDIDSLYEYLKNCKK